MIVVKVPLPADHYRYVSDAPLDDYELDSAKDAGIDAVVYYYGSGSYEGSGAALLRKAGDWAYADLGHCSCYGPLDPLPTLFEPLAVLRSRMSKELRVECDPLFDAVAQRGLDLT
jgi:hypothetical protein